MVGFFSFGRKRKARDALEGDQSRQRPNPAEMTHDQRSSLLSSIPAASDFDEARVDQDLDTDETPKDLLSVQQDATPVANIAVVARHDSEEEDLHCTSSNDSEQDEPGEDCEIVHEEDAQDGNQSHDDQDYGSQEDGSQAQDDEEDGFQQRYGSEEASDEEGRAEDDDSSSESEEVPSEVFNSSMQRPERSAAHNADMRNCHKRLHLLNLPLAIRNEISIAVLVHTARLADDTGDLQQFVVVSAKVGDPASKVPFLKVCHQIREQATPVFYLANRMVIEVEDWDVTPLLSWWARVDRIRQQNYLDLNHFTVLKNVVLGELFIRANYNLNWENLLEWFRLFHHKPMFCFDFPDIEHSIGGSREQFMVVVAAFELMRNVDSERLSWSVVEKMLSGTKLLLGQWDEEGEWSPVRSTPSVQEEQSEYSFAALEDTSDTASQSFQTITEELDEADQYDTGSLTSSQTQGRVFLSEDEDEGESELEAFLHATASEIGELRKQVLASHSGSKTKVLSTATDMIHGFPMRPTRPRGRGEVEAVEETSFANAAAFDTSTEPAAYQITCSPHAGRIQAFHEGEASLANGVATTSANAQKVVQLTFDGHPRDFAQTVDPDTGLTYLTQIKSTDPTSRNLSQRSISPTPSSSQINCFAPSPIVDDTQYSEDEASSENEQLPSKTKLFGGVRTASRKHQTLDEVPETPEKSSVTHTGSCSTSPMMLPHIAFGRKTSKVARRNAEDVPEGAAIATSDAQKRRASFLAALKARDMEIGEQSRNLISRGTAFGYD